jgi:7-cyano-7-deazaguanine synthase in queuosine biosynthesis
VETKAIDNILDWLRKNGLDNFEFFTTRFEFLAEGKSYDYNVIAFINALMFRLEEFDEIKKLLVCLNAGDTNATPFPDTLKYYTKVEADPGFPGTSGGKEMEVEFPVLEIEKKDVAEMIPEGLRQLCWSCATPRYDKKTGQLVPCNRCQSCFRIR